MSLIRSLSSAIKSDSGDTPVYAGLYAIDPQTGNEDKTKPGLAFQYFPESITDSKSPEYSSRTIPGGSHPIRTFVAGGDRTLSFQAIFTQESSPGGTAGGGLQGLVASAFSSVTPGAKPIKSDTDIASTIRYLRSFIYPEYQTGGSRILPPQMCALYLPGSGIYSASPLKDSIICFMTQCNVTYEYFHRDGTPRIVTVDLAFAESVQFGQNWKFKGTEDFKSNGFDKYIINATAGRDLTVKSTGAGGVVGGLIDAGKALLDKIPGFK